MNAHHKYLILFIFLFIGHTHAAEPNYPARPVRMLVGFTPGGTSDVVARIISKKLSDTWGQQFVVDNRAGAAGMLATELTARAAPDGHTLIFISSSFAMQPSTTPNLPYDALRDFTPVTLAVSSPYVLVVHPAVEAKSVKELIVLAKAKPGALSSATAGPGSAIHVTAELFNTMAGVNILLVPYKGAVGITDLIAGQVQMTFAGFPQTMPHVKSGRLRVLGISTQARSPLLPDTPTVAEGGVPGFDVAIWYGLIGPAKLPRPILTKLHRGVAQVLKAPDVRQSLTDLSLDIIGNTPEQFAAVIRSDMDKWVKLAKNTSKK
ncbi:MAG TPA: tripartite tricarboxylate transporter substrate binding protein [Burkholderiales bacterium]|nr:tripartite tricarboxylate transporter substrate binding protein [Burkholderiales bacterium]